MEFAIELRQGLGSNPEYFRFYADKIENIIHSAAASPIIQDRDAFAGTTSTERQAACTATGISSNNCSRERGPFSNANASITTELYLYQTWARPNLVDGAFITSTDEATGAVTRTGTPATTYFADLEAMTAELKTSYRAAFDQARADGSGGFTAIAPVGEAFMRAVNTGVATRDMWAADAATDGLVDLWFDDGTHASTYGSYLSALTLFGSLTGLDPASRGGDESAARDLGIGLAGARVAAGGQRPAGLCRASARTRNPCHAAGRPWPAVCRCTTRTQPAATCGPSPRRQQALTCRGFCLRTFLSIGA